MKNRLLGLTRMRPEVSVACLYARKFVNRIREKRISGPYPGIGPDGWTGSAQYCYDVWVNHLDSLRKCGMHSIPRVAAELGPGNSLGVGLSMLLSGTEKYIALDMTPYSSPKDNLTIFDSLISIFQNPNGRIQKVLPADQLQMALQPERLAEIRDTITHVNSKNSGICVFYKVPWDSPAVIEESTLDMICSQSVLEHVSDIGTVYAAMNRWL